MAMTIMEAMISLVILVIAIIGASGYRYQAALGARQADLYSTGVRMTLLLCEAWSGVGGAASFDPISIFSPDLDITASAGIGAPTGFTELGSYQMIVEGVTYYATMSWKDMGAGITSLHVVVSWNPRSGGTSTIGNAIKSYRLTTYVKTPS